MGPDYFEQVEEYNMRSLLYAGLITGGILLIFYYLWSWCSDRESKQDEKSNNKGKLTMKPVYAHEIEPGIVVLQSEEGEYFKILREYELNAGSSNLYGSFSCTRPENAQPGIHTKISQQTPSQNMAIRQFQSHGPSAPLIFDSEGTEGTFLGDNPSRASGSTANVNSAYSLMP